MSGGGGGAGGGGPDVDSDVPCDRLVFETELQSVRLSVARRVKPADRLSVVIDGPGQPIVARHKRHGDVGSIISRIPDLLRCHDRGYSYEAEVLTVSSARIHVRVAPE